MQYIAFQRPIEFQEGSSSSETSGLLDASPWATPERAAEISDRKSSSAAGRAGPRPRRSRSAASRVADGRGHRMRARLPPRRRVARCIPLARRQR